MITGVDHVQLAMPRGREDTARSFYAGLLEMTELIKPAVLAVRGGCWFASGAAVLHLGVEEPFAPARKAHPALLVDDLDRLEAALTAAGHSCVRADSEIPGVRRFHTHDPFGNRVEFQQVLSRFSLTDGLAIGRLRLRAGIRWSGFKAGIRWCGSVDWGARWARVVHARSSVRPSTTLWAGQKAR